MTATLRAPQVGGLGIAGSWGEGEIPSNNFLNKIVILEDHVAFKQNPKCKFVGIDRRKQLFIFQQTLQEREN